MECDGVDDDFVAPTILLDEEEGIIKEKVVCRVHAANNRTDRIEKMIDFMVTRISPAHTEISSNIRLCCRY